jgi:hypothetical protein
MTTGTHDRGVEDFDCGGKGGIGLVEKRMNLRIAELDARAKEMVGDVIPTHVANGLARPPTKVHEQNERYDTSGKN